MSRRPPFGARRAVAPLRRIDAGDRAPRGRPAHARRLRADAPRLHRDLWRSSRSASWLMTGAGGVISFGQAAFRRHRRLCERLVDDRDGWIALRRARHRARRLRRHRSLCSAPPPCGSAAISCRSRPSPGGSPSTTSSAMWKRSGPITASPPSRRSASAGVSLVSAKVLLLFRLAAPRARHAALVQSPRFARGPRHSRAAREAMRSSKASASIRSGRVFASSCSRRFSPRSPAGSMRISKGW